MGMRSVRADESAEILAVPLIGWNVQNLIILWAPYRARPLICK